MQKNFIGISLKEKRPSAGAQSNFRFAEFSIYNPSKLLIYLHPAWNAVKQETRARSGIIVPNSGITYVMKTVLQQVHPAPTVDFAPVNCAELPIGRILQMRGFISDEDLARGLEFQQQFGGRLGAILVRIGALSESNLLSALSEQLGLPVAMSDEIPTEPAHFMSAIALSGQSAEWWLDQEAMIWAEPATGIVFCVARDPLLPSLNETVDMAFAATHTVQWGLILNQDLDRILDLVDQALRHDQRNVLDEISHLRELAEEAPVVELVSNSFSQALSERASDIHIEPEEKRFRIRYRIDGVLHTRLTLPRDRFDAVASRVKLLSGMDIAERRLPQDGRSTQRINGENVDVRVSALPGTWGESLVMRLLPKQRKQFQLSRLGMEPHQLAPFETAINEPNGIVLVTGPTGSGKSTTLYSALEAINDGSKKIITVEDPVEYDITGVNQVQVHSDIGYNFSRALRSILRQDPDVIMIGEIRDLETAEIAVQASLTGHLVFSTLHTNDALTAFTRLVDMGVEPFLVASAVRGVLAQRLVRRLCPACARPGPAPHEDIVGTIKIEQPRWLHAVGCPQCQNTGYKGRLGIYEIVTVTPDLQEAILKRQPPHILTAIARKEGFLSLRQDGLVKAAAGLTSLDEVMRVTGLEVAET
jgi:general secretion pathway protein E